MYSKNTYHQNSYQHVQYSATSATPREENENNLINIANYDVRTNKQKKLIYNSYLYYSTKQAHLTHSHYFAYTSEVHLELCWSEYNRYLSEWYFLYFWWPEEFFSVQTYIPSTVRILMYLKNLEKGEWPGNFEFMSWDCTETNRNPRVFIPKFFFMLILDSANIEKTAHWNVLGLRPGYAAWPLN